MSTAIGSQMSLFGQVRATVVGCMEACPMKALALSAVLVLAGCATVGETMTSKEPSGVYQTMKSPREYRDCFVDSSGAQAYSITDRDGGYLFALSAGAGQAFSAMPRAEGGSTVTVWGLLGTRRDARMCV